MWFLDNALMMIPENLVSNSISQGCSKYNDSIIYSIDNKFLSNINIKEFPYLKEIVKLKEFITFDNCKSFK